MKKYSLILLALCAGSQLAAWEWFEKNVSKPTKKVVKKAKSEVEKAVRKVEEGFKNPEKVAIDAAKEAVKVADVNVNGIERSVRNLKGAQPKIQGDIKAVQKAIKEPTSPMTKLPTVAQKMKAFQQQAMAAVKRAPIGDLQNALGSPQALVNIVAQQVNPENVAMIKQLYASYDAILAEIDSIEIRPILIPMRQTVLDIAGSIDDVLNIFKYSGQPGKLGKMAVGNPIMASSAAISRDLKKIGADLNLMIQGGKKSVRASQVPFAFSLLANLQNIIGLTVTMTQKPGIIIPMVNNIQPYVAKAQENVQKLSSTASGINSRLKRLMLKKIKSVSGTFDVPRAAIKELQTIVAELRKYLNYTLLNMSDAVGQVADILQEGVKSMNEFTAGTGFDLLPAKSRSGANALPRDTQSLSNSIERLRIAIKNK